MCEACSKCTFNHPPDKCPGLCEVGLKSPESQSIEAVKWLITYYHGEEPAEMPKFYRPNGEMVLVLSNNKNCYYTVTAKTCSCQESIYGLCKHQKKYFGIGRPSSSVLEMLIDAYAPVTTEGEIEYWRVKQVPEA